jgi:hypothetical protein
MEITLDQVNDNVSRIQAEINSIKRNELASFSNILDQTSQNRALPNFQISSQNQSQEQSIFRVLPINGAGPTQSAPVKMADRAAIFIVDKINESNDQNDINDYILFDKQS